MNKKNKAFFSSLTFNEKCYFILLFLILVPAFIKLLMGINARAGLSIINPYLSSFLYVGLFFFSFKSFKCELRWWDFLVVLLIGLFCFYSPNIYPETRWAIIEFAPSFVFASLPFYLMGASVNLQKHNMYFEKLGRAGFLVNLLVAIVSLSGLTNTYNVGEERMGLAYNFLPSIILVLRNQLVRPNSKDLILSIMGGFLLMSLGTRGAILALGLYFVGFLILFKKYSYPVLSRLGIFLLFLLFYVFLPPIINLMSIISESFGLSTRTYEKIMEGDLTNTDTRDWIYEKVIDYISKDDGSIGYGFFYDRVIMGMDSSSYCHNLFFEVCLNFGIIIGGALLIAFFAAIIINLIRYRRTNASSLYFALFCACVVQLFFSLSYLISILFWFFVGVTVSAIRKSRVGAKFN